MKNDIKAMIERAYTDDKRHWLAVASRRGTPSDLIEDILHDGFVRALRFLKSFDNSKDFNGWLFTIINNARKDALRCERMMGMSVEYSDELEGWHTSKLDGLMLSEISEGISKEPQPKQDILKLYFLYEYNPKDIVKVLPVSNNQVRSCVKRYRKFLEGVYGEKVRS